MSRRFKIEYGHLPDIDIYMEDASGGDVKNFILEEADFDYITDTIITPLDNLSDNLYIKRIWSSNTEWDFFVRLDPASGFGDRVYSKEEVYRKFREKFPGAVGGKRRSSRRRSKRRATRGHR